MLFDSIQITEGASIMNLTVASGSSLPTTPNEGEVFFHTGDNLLYIYTGSEWDSIQTSAVSVTSVAGRTGTVTLSVSDISGLNKIASSGLYSDLSGKPNLATVATSGSYSDLSNQPTITTLNGIPSSALGVANGVATLDGAGLIQASQLPSYVDDVLEFATQSLFPTIGASGKIYIDASSSKTFRWTGSIYVEIVASPGTTDAIAEGTTNLFFTAARASSAAPVQSVAGRGGSVILTHNDIVGLATVAASGSYLDLSNLPTIPVVTGTNTGDQTITLSGDVTGTGTGTFATTLATVNSNVGSFGNTTSIPVLTVDAKGRVTAVSTATIAAGGVQSVAGRSGGIVLYQNDISGLTTTSSPSFTAVTANLFTGNLAGNATTATKLQTPASINGVNFDGSADITIAANANSLTGTSLASNVVSSSLTSVGTLSSLNVSGGITASSLSGSITSGQVTAGLGFTPYNASNPSGYISSSGAPVQSVAGRTGAITLSYSDISGSYAGTVTSTQVTTALGFTPYNATNPSNFITSLQAPVQSIAGRGGSVTLSQSDISGLTVGSSPTFVNVTASLTGNASTATTLQTARALSASGDATGTSAVFDGSSAVTIPLVLATVNSSPVSGSFQKITVNGKGLTTATTAVTASDIEASLGFTPANKAGDTFTGAVLLASDPTQALGAATKQYVDNVSAGLVVKPAVQTSTTSALAATYANGTSGVGATLTASSNGVLTNIGGYSSLVVGSRILVKDQADQTQNGIYTITSLGAVGAPYVLTRAPEFDNTPVGEMLAGDFTYVQFGTLGGTQWSLTTPGTITVGTSNISWTQLSGAGVITGGTGISVAGNVVSNAGVTSAVAGSNITVSGATGAVTVALAASPTITGTNFSGIPNTALTNSSVTINAGAGLYLLKFSVWSQQYGFHLLHGYRWCDLCNSNRK